MIERADRMQSIPPYFFAQLGRRIEALRAEGKDVIRLDMGSPDMPPADHIIRALVESAESPGNHGYTPFGGTAGFRRAAAAHYQRRFGVELDPEKEVVGLIGSKEGLFNIAQAMVNPGDIVLVPDPGYPVYRTSARFAGGEVVHMPLTADRDYLPDFDALSPEIRRRTRMMWLNYPNNPTGATAGLSFFDKAVAFARENEVLICHDAPYTEVCFDGYAADSILQVPGARKVAIEFNSLSKAYNMAGWRVGMAVGNEAALDALYTLKTQMDTSQFLGILEAGEAALRSDQSWLEGRNAVYGERRDLILGAIPEIGLRADKPKASLYVWAALPEGVESAMDFCGRMLEEVHVSMTPGVAFGEAGEGYVRISLGSPTARVAEAMNRIAAWEYKPS